MGDFFGDLLVRAISWIIPILLIASFLVNTKTPKSRQSKPEEKKSKPAVQEKPSSSQQSSSPLSDEDMTE